MMENAMKQMIDQDCWKLLALLRARADDVAHWPGFLNDDPNRSNDPSYGQGISLTS